MLSLEFTNALDVAFAHAKQILDPSAHARLEKGFKLCATEQVRAIPFQDGHWFVQGPEVEPYLVVREPAWQCDCPDHHYRKELCAHIIAVQLWVRATQTAQTTQPEPVAPVAAPVAPEPLYEAPSSVNCHLMIEGRQVQLTLRDSDEGRLLERLATILRQYPILPSTSAKNPRSAPGEGSDKGARDWCSIHACAMQRHENAKGVWYSHYIENRHCKGR